MTDAEPTCKRCGYLLRGLRDPRCPECGEPFAVDADGEPVRARTKFSWRGVIVVLTLISPIVLALAYMAYAIFSVMNGFG